MQIIKTVHARKGWNLWVVTIEERLPKEQFNEMLESAKAVGGWYSWYKAEGAVPGFQFKHETAAELFLAEQSTDPDNEPEPVPFGDDCPPSSSKGDERSGGGSPVPPVPKPATWNPKPATPSDPQSTAWLKLANSYASEAAKKFKDLEHAQSNTPKRMREYNSKRVSAEIFDDMAKLARGLASQYAAGTIRHELRILQPVKSKGHLAKFVPGHASNGYYDAHRAELPYWVKGKHKPEIDGITSYEQALNIWHLLKELDKTSGDEIKQRETANEIKRLEDTVRFAKIEGFFPTPPELVNRMIRELHINPGDIILEPSAGMGSIAEIVRQQYPENQIITCEINHTLHKILTLKGFDNNNDDFLESGYQADKIIMNPPFENWMDIDHVIHAWNQLKTGGDMVAIMGAGAITGTTKKHQRFNDWLYASGATLEKLPDGSFKSAFRQTGVSTYLVIARK